MQLKNSLGLLTLVLAILFLPGCATSPNMVMLIPDNNGNVGAATVKDGADVAVLENSGEAVSLARGKLVKQKRATSAQRTFSAALKAEPAPPTIFIIYFEFGTAQILTDSNAALEEATKYVEAHASKQVFVYGHTDRVGEAAYNKELSLNRARTVGDSLVHRGVPEDSLVLAGFGESEPAPVSPDGTPQVLNRRVEIRVH